MAELVRQGRETRAHLDAASAESATTALHDLDNQRTDDHGN